MGKLSSTLKKGDMFGGQWGITFNGDDNHKTVCGFFCTIFYLVITIAAGVYFLLEYIDVTNPTVSSEVIIGENYPTVNFHDYSFFFTISAVYQGRYLLYSELEKVVDIEVKNVQENFDKATATHTVTNTISEMRACQAADFKIGTSNIQGGNGMVEGAFAACPVSKNLIMEGHREDPIYKYITIDFKPCTAGCWANVTTELSNVHIVFSFVEASVIPSNYANPFKYHLNKNHEFNLDDNVEYFRKFYFRSLEVDTD